MLRNKYPSSYEDSKQEKSERKHVRWIIFEIYESVMFQKSFILRFFLGFSCLLSSYEDRH